jgi:hypothetical protein
MTGAVSGATSTAKDAPNRVMGPSTPSIKEASWPSAIQTYASAAPAGPAMSMARAPILSPNPPKTLDRSPTLSVKGTNGSEDRRSGIPRRYGNYICHLLENFAPRCDLIQ